MLCHRNSIINGIEHFLIFPLRQRRVDYMKRKADKEKFKLQLSEANAKVQQAQKMAPPAIPSAPSDGVIRRPKDPPPSFASLMDERKKESKSVVSLHLMFQNYLLY